MQNGDIHWQALVYIVGEFKLSTLTFFNLKTIGKIKKGKLFNIYHMYYVVFKTPFEILFYVPVDSNILVETFF